MNNYQNVVVENKEYGKSKRKKSKYFNEGKWDNFISPLLPKDCSGLTIIDFGCNYGLFLNLAKERGFEGVIGIECNPEVASVARSYVGKNATVITKQIDENIYHNGFLNKLVASDYILMANFHYHTYISAFIHFLNIMKRKTRYAIVVSAEDARSKLYHAKHDIASVRRYFRQWKEVDHITIPDTPDPTPRKMFSLLFKTDIERLPISKIKFGRYGSSFYKKVKRGQDNEVPMTYPVLLRQDGSMVDGHHRMAYLESIGVKTILTEKV